MKKPRGLKYGPIGNDFEQIECLSILVFFKQLLVCFSFFLSVLVVFISYWGMAVN